MPTTTDHPALPADRLCLTAREAAKALGISPRLLWTLTHAGHLPHLRLGTRVLYPLAELREYLAVAAADRD